MRLSPKCRDTDLEDKFLAMTVIHWGVFEDILIGSAVINCKTLFEGDMLPPLFEEDEEKADDEDTNEEITDQERPTRTERIMTRAASVFANNASKKMKGSRDFDDDEEREEANKKLKPKVEERQAKSREVLKHTKAVIRRPLLRNELVAGEIEATVEIVWTKRKKRVVQEKSCGCSIS